MGDITLFLKNETSEISRVHQTMTGLSSQYGWPSEFLFEIELALEEVVMNVISYAFDDEQEHEFLLRLSASEKGITAQIEDDGKAFNPLEAPEPRLDLPLEDRTVGGLGIFLTKKMMDEVEYQRVDGKNILTIKKALNRSTDE